uniref:Uncharacterized protein n=1 Tax=Steinernema glaseri TaxID=37863 RepID=A0A1I7YUL4_9BILA
MHLPYSQKKACKRRAFDWSSTGVKALKGKEGPFVSYSLLKRKSTPTRKSDSFWRFVRESPIRRLTVGYSSLFWGRLNVPT